MSAITDTLSLNFWRQPDTYTQRVTRKELRELLLLNEPVVAQGSLYDIKHKYIGVGVYEISLEKRRYG